jgi:hypothetical protein
MQLSKTGLKANDTAKSFFRLGEPECLGYLLMREGVKPMLKKTKGLLQLAPPKTKKQLRNIIRMINYYYRNRWVWWIHSLAPWTKLTSKDARWKWGPTQQLTFDNITKVNAQEVLLMRHSFSSFFY